MNRIGDLGLLVGFSFWKFILNFRLCYFKTAIAGATNLDMYWFSAAFALFISLW
jgi:NADH-quinone oxidoreductase subunit L